MIHDQPCMILRDGRTKQEFGHVALDTRGNWCGVYVDGDLVPIGEFVVVRYFAMGGQAHAQAVKEALGAR